MRTRQRLISRLEEMIKVEEDKIFIAPSRWFPTNISLLEDKIKGLKALRDEISASTGHYKDTPAQDWLKKTIKDIVNIHPKLIEGLGSDTRQLLQNIAPGWDIPSPISVASSSSTLYKRPSPEYDYFFRIELVGDSGVGKSSTLLRFADGTFTNSFISTLGVDFKIKKIDNIKLQLWDSAGGVEVFRRTATSELQAQRGRHAVILMFDVTNQETFSNISGWLHEVDKAYGKNVCRFIVGTKTDLESDRHVSFEEAKEMADQLNLPYIEISAKDNKNVDELFAYIATYIKALLEDDTPPFSFEEYLKDLEEKQKPTDAPGGCTIS